MKSERSIFDTTQYPIWLGILLSLVAIVLAVRSLGGELLPAEQIVTPSFWGDKVYEWQQSNPTWSRIITLLTTIYLAVKVGILTKKFNLMGQPTHLPFDLFTLMGVGILVNVSYLRLAIMALVVVSALSLFFSSYRSANSASWLFDGGLYLGLLPMLYPPAVVLFGVIPFVLILFDRTLREALTALLGFLTIPFGYLYITWFLEGDISTPMQQFAHDLMTHSGFRFNALYNNITIAIVVLVLYSILNAVLVSPLMENTPKAKRRIRVVVVMAIFIGAMLLFPSVDSSVFGLIAIPASILTAVTLIKSPRWLSFMLYWALVATIIFRLL